MTDPEVIIVALDLPEPACICCGVSVRGPGQGVPMLDGLVLPNDWPGDWGGFDACIRCYAVQQLITEPTLPEDIANA